MTGQCGQRTTGALLHDIKKKVKDGIINGVGLKDSALLKAHWEMAWHVAVIAQGHVHTHQIQALVAHNCLPQIITHTLPHKCPKFTAGWHRY